MGFNQIIELEYEGLFNTIIDYTTEQYIKSYIKKLGNLQYPQDKNMIQILLTRIHEWYEIELPQIQSSAYLINKKEHLKSIRIIEDLLEQID